jgi:ERCC4-type nuclease|tara:strand:+ start:2883 stop:3635 length:753 start_codon:yes stop_codon:yes gene_type:complete
MKIVIDSHEKNLYQNMNKFIIGNEIKNIVLNQKTLDVGDILITTNEDVPLICFERKTVNDLLSSIVDGRYKEQSLRLDNINVHNHNIIYLIEGEIRTNDLQKRKMFYSSLFTIFYKKGFSLFHTGSIFESAELIVRFTDKILREKEIIPFYTLENNNERKNIDYVDVIHNEKKKNINKENIHIIMLSQIPNVSTNFAKAIFKTYKNLDILIQCLKENNSCLDNLKYTTSNNQERKISKTCIENIKKYLLV